MIAMDAGAAELDDLAAHALVGGEAELLFAVVAEVAAGDVAHLDAVGTDDLSGGAFLDDQVVADVVEAVLVVAVDEGRLQTLVELEVEDQEAEAIGRGAFAFG